MAARDPDRLFASALGAHQAGRLAEAETAYRAVLSAHPRYVPALTNLGILELQRGNRTEGLRLLGRSLELNADQPTALINRGAALNDLGRHAEALASFDRALVLRPQEAGAHNNRGNALSDLGRHAEALAGYERAIALRPDYAEAHNNRGTVLRALGRETEALASFDRALALRPDYASAHNNRGTALGALGRHEEALESYDRALGLRPDYAEAHGNRAAALNALGRHAEALAGSDRAIALRPDHAGAHCNRGDALRGLGRLESALASYDQALALQPVLVEALSNRAIALARLKRHAEALAGLERALALRPDYAEAHNSRGNVLRDLQRLAEAQGSYERALALRPDYAEAHSNLGNVLKDLGRMDAALARYDRAIALRPEAAESLHNRGIALAEMRRYEEALADFNRAFALNPELDALAGNRLHARMHLCDWTDFDADSAALFAALDRGRAVSEPFPLLAMPSTPAQQRRCAELYAARRFAAAGAFAGDLRHPKHERIRLGYFSADFRNHALAHLVAELIERHDRARFEVYGYSFGPDTGDAMRERLERAFDRFTDVRARSDREIAALARSHEIDIALDLTGYTTHSRTGIFSHRAAPAQVNYLGYPGTLGAPFMDYLIADPVVIPEEHFRHYSEKIVWLPHSYQANDTKRVVSGKPFTRRELGLPETGFVFCCFNNSFKLTPDVFDIWMRLLTRIEGSVLWLLEGSAATAGNLRQEAAKRGVDPGRLVFAGRMELSEHLARHRLADLFLDTLYYGAHTTASDALWSGLPVLTCHGETFASRVAASLLTALGLPELIAQSRAEYETLALELAMQPGELEVIRKKLASNRTGKPLFDIGLFTTGIEQVYTRMWERRDAGPPA